MLAIVDLSKRSNPQSSQEWPFRSTTQFCNIVLEILSSWYTLLSVSISTEPDPANPINGTILHTCRNLTWLIHILMSTKTCTSPQPHPQWSLRPVFIIRGTSFNLKLFKKFAFLSLPEVTPDTFSLSALLRGRGGSFFSILCVSGQGNNFSSIMSVFHCPFQTILTSKVKWS